MIYFDVEANMKKDNFKWMKRELVFKAWRVSIVLSIVFAFAITLISNVFMQIVSAISSSPGPTIYTFISVVFFTTIILLTLITPAMLVNMHMNDEQFHDDQGGGE